MRLNERFTVEERAARWQRRGTGPWTTGIHEIAGVRVTIRQRRRREISFARWDVAWHDLLRHVLERQVIVPVLRRLALLISETP